MTPPPCVRLVIYDIDTGKEIDYKYGTFTTQHSVLYLWVANNIFCSEIDCAMFVLNVDLWNEGGTQEVNLVRPVKENSSSSPPTIGFPYGQFNGAEQPLMQYPSQMIPSRDATYRQPHPMGFVPEYHHISPGYGQGKKQIFVWGKAKSIRKADDGT